MVMWEVCDKLPSTKLAGFLEIFMVFVNRELGGSGNFAGQVLLLTAKTARRKDVIP